MCLMTALIKNAMLARTENNVFFLMLVLIQRVSSASVAIEQEIVASIATGILALVCVEERDQKKHYEKMVHKLLNQRIFEDECGKMNNSLLDIKGELLLIPQFTLAADTERGLRPSFSSACPPIIAKEKFTEFCHYLSTCYQRIAQGCFGANMQVSLINDGPVTLWLKV